MLNDASQLRLDGVHPRLAAIIRHASTQSAVPFQVLEGLRTIERQRHLVKLGRSHTMDSLHLKQPDGYAYAVDLIAYGDINRDGKENARDRALVWDPAVYRIMAEDILKVAKIWRATVIWGGNFQGFFDGPHFQLKAWRTIPETDDEPFQHANPIALRGQKYWKGKA